MDQRDSSRTRTADGERDLQEEALRVNNVGLFQIEPGTQVIRWSTEMERLFGYQPDTFDGTRETWRQHVMPDTGPGLTGNRVKRLFVPFQSTTRGAGLGLAICRTIIEAHGGTMQAASKVGCGLEFTITLPSAEDDVKQLA